MNITTEKLKQITGINDNNMLLKLVDGINRVTLKYNIDTSYKLAHFISQMQHECANFSRFTENLNYSEKALLSVFGKYFNTTTAKQYARKPSMIANKVYANRMGNGSEISGDGWKYRGRGAIQCTGKDKYVGMTKEFGIDFLNNPDMLAEAPYAIMSAGWYWNSRNINNSINIIPSDDNSILADIKQVTRLVNGGTNGLSDRISKFKKAYSILK